MTIFFKRIAQTVRTDDNFFRTDSQSRSNGWQLFLNGYPKPFKRIPNPFENGTPQGTFSRERSRRGTDKICSRRPLIHRFSSSLTFVVFYILNCRGEFLCFVFVTLLRVTRTLWKYFPMLIPPPHWKIRQIDPPPPSPLENPIPSVGGYGYFLEPHNLARSERPETKMAALGRDSAVCGHLSFLLLSRVFFVLKHTDYV